MATSVEQHVEEYSACVQDPWHFITNYVHISVPGVGDVNFEAWPHLEDLCNITMNNDRIIILKARQIGVTWFYVALAMWYALFRPNSNILVISIRQIESTEFKRRAKYIYRHLPEWLQVPIGKDNDEVLEFPTLDSAIHSLPATEDSGRSSTANVVILDEWAFQEYARSIYTAILPTVANGKLIGISTANGKNNLFYNIWESAKNSLNAFLPLFIPYTVAPQKDGTMRDKKWWTGVAADMESVEEAMREYPDDEAEAFAVMQNSLFDPAALNAMPVMEGNPWGNYSEIWRDYDPNRVYSAAIDPAPGGGDPSVLHIFNDGLEQSAKTTTNEDIDKFAEEAFELLKFYGFPMINIERQGEGNTVIRYFLKADPDKGKVAYPEHKMYRGSANKIGWYTGKDNREEILADLRKRIRERQYIIYSKTTIVELKGFGPTETRTGTIKYQGIYGHDDEVMALALLNHIVETALPPLNPEEWEPTDYVSRPGQIDTNDLNSKHWGKETPLECDHIFYVKAEDSGHTLRQRCGIRHNTLSEMKQCPHQ